MAEGGAGGLREVLQDLTLAPGVPGQEHAVREVISRSLSGVGHQERDGLGNLCCRVPGGADRPRVALAAHMDEVGFTVTHVTDEGYLRFLPLGGWWEQVMLAQRVTVHTRAGVLDGVVGSKPPHVLSADDRRKVVEKRDMFIDVGARTSEEAEAWGVRPGDAVVPVCPFVPMRNPDLVMAKALDDRAGCAVLVEVLRRLGAGPHPNTVYGIATVQEEVGLRGAESAARTWPPDVAFSLDVGIAGDTPGVSREEARGKLGAGPSLCVYDASLVPNPRLRDFVADVAAAQQIAVQWEAMPGGGTDAGRLQFAGSGVPCLYVGFPTRYIHSAASVVHLGDLEATVRLLLAVIGALDADALERIRP